MGQPGGDRLVARGCCVWPELCRRSIHVRVPSAVAVRKRHLVTEYVSFPSPDGANAKQNRIVT